ncbi:MAG: phosphoglycerate kinase [Candidatus Mcinerneyibacterium aminivorans]|uniref:Phosphoglycerate kinase n=1 Tax=Candidatus Mcinerneyibacterium aminivorans TaxID=2703815 RepID=A0A5D0MDB4_9BACT|nr:MAG: phosphoglycerate kinase [Candidatus Mcinerneyibacterium aminivorans]
MIGHNLSKIKTVRDFDLNGKKIFLRGDLNCPIENNVVKDDTRIEALLPTIKYIIENNGQIVLVSHHGRPHGEYIEDLSLKPVARRLEEILDIEVSLVDCRLDDKKIQEIYENNQKVTMLENIRFCPEEREGDRKYAKKMSKIADIYINDAFGTCHRKHLSTFFIVQYFEKKGIGLLVERELKTYADVLENPSHPLIVVMGGSKVSDKIRVIKNMMSFADTFLIGGGMAYTLMKVKGYDIGNSLFEKEVYNVAKETIEYIENDGVDFILPQDHLIVKDIDKPENKRYSRQIPEGWIGVDIGLKTIENYRKVILEAGTVIWNGPMGIFEKTEYAEGTKLIAKAIAETSAFTVVGGGDSGRAIRSFNLNQKVDFVSTGGGASLRLLEGYGLPCVEILEEK